MGCHWCGVFFHCYVTIFCCINLVADPPQPVWTRVLYLVSLCNKSSFHICVGFTQCHLIGPFVSFVLNIVCICLLWSVLLAGIGWWAYMLLFVQLKFFSFVSKLKQNIMHWSHFPLLNLQRIEESFMSVCTSVVCTKLRRDSI